MSVAAIQNALQGASALGVTPKAAASANSSSASSSSSSSSSTNSATITSNDFLTLLVTELKNQDPTATTDPNQYIDQLVQINSLQQLIGINSGISNLDSAVGATSSSTSSHVSTGPVAHTASTSTDKASAIANALAK